MESQNKEQRTGLVLEGGSMRGLFTAGVLDVFMDEDIKVDGIVGVSAGAVFGPNYFSRQKGRVLRYNKRFCRNRRYMSLLSLLLTGNMINKQFAFYDVTTKYDIFDHEAFIKNNTGYYVAVTNVETGQPEYFEIKDILKDMEILRASSALPFVSQMVDINGNRYLDGGISDSIPVFKCKSLGYDKIIVVLTRPFDYRKKPFSKQAVTFMSHWYKQYPEFVQTMVNRHHMYNQTVEAIQEMEHRGEIFVIRPSEPILLKTIERNQDKLQAVYDLGVRNSKERLEALRKYLQG